jgi:hypothetical protein
VFAQQLGHPVGFGDYLQLAFLTSAVATLAGALGSLTESEFAVREAMYRYRPDGRTDDLRRAGRPRPDSDPEPEDSNGRLVPSHGRTRASTRDDPGATGD